MAEQKLLGFIRRRVPEQKLTSRSGMLSGGDAQKGGLTRGKDWSAILLKSCKSSFMAEAIALEQATESVNSKMGIGPHTIHGQETPFSVHDYRLIIRY